MSEQLNSSTSVTSTQGFRRHLTEAARRRSEQTRAVLSIERAFRKLRTALDEAETLELLESLRSQIGGAK